MIINTYDTIRRRWIEHKFGR